MNNDIATRAADAGGGEVLLDQSARSLDQGGAWLLDLVAAVDHLRRGARPRLTVWDAIGEAAAWAHAGADTDIADSSFNAALLGLLNENPGGEAAAVQAAIQTWVLVMANRYNDGHHWPHPIPRRAFPPGAINAAVSAGSDLF